MTPEEFCDLRDRVGRSWGPPCPLDDTADDAAKVGWQRSYIARLVDMTEPTIRRWEEPGGEGPHPTVLRVIEWTVGGWAPPQIEVPDWTGAEFAATRQRLGLDLLFTAELLNVEAEVIEAWETDPGPHPTARAVLFWMDQGTVPPHFP